MIPCELCLWDDSVKIDRSKINRAIKFYFMKERGYFGRCKRHAVPKHLKQFELSEEEATILEVMKS
jgi:hypothetical protein